MPSYAGPSVTARPGEVASTLRLLGYLALAIALVIFDHRGGWLSQFREHANVVTQPLWWLAGLPGRLGTRVQDDAGSRTRLTTENRNLRNELLIANARLTRLQTAALDNAQLRELLNVAERNGLDVQLAPILDIDLDPVKQRLVLDSGSRAGVHVGQAVIDSGGLMGQVIAVTPAHSTVLLLTDPDHAVPVAVARTGVRLIVYGRGDRLELRDIPLSAGVEVGDEIVTSGLGGRFPAGFPVGKILKLRPDDTHAFLVGELEPAAKLDRGRNVLLLRSVPALPQLPDSSAIESAPEAAAAGGPSVAPVNRMGAAATVVPAVGNAANPPAAAATQAPASTPATEPAAAGQAPAPATTPANESASPATPVTTDNPTPPQVRP